MWYMTEEMRAVATARMQADRVSESEASHGVMYGIKLACKDYKLYLFVSHYPTTPARSNRLLIHSSASLTSA